MLKIYTINLDRRTDRWSEARANYSAYGLEPRAITRFSAVAQPQFGALGCAKSHVAVLADFLCRSTEALCLVLEDDFDFVRPFSDFVQGYNLLTHQRIEWDVLLLMGTQTLAYNSEVRGLARVLEAQSTAAYLVSRRYAARLLACFGAVVPQMETLSAPGLRTFAMSRLSIDLAWKPLQRQDRWYIFDPAIGHQRPSYSDIELRNVDYDAQTYGLTAPAESKSSLD